MSNFDYIKQHFESLEATDAKSALQPLRRRAFDSFTRWGVPVKHEEWKYTRISPLFNKEYKLGTDDGVTPSDVAGVRLPGHESASELIFVNGAFNETLSNVRSGDLVVMALEQ